MYEVGTHIDLSHINRKAAVLPAQKKTITTRPTTTGRLFDVGTQFVFSGHKAARRIQVVFA